MSAEKQTYYSGYLLLGEGHKVSFEDIAKDMMDSKLLEAVNNSKWTFNNTEMIWLDGEDLLVPACKVIGFSIIDHEE
jgi:hypothetical protein